METTNEKLNRAYGLSNEIIIEGLRRDERLRAVEAVHNDFFPAGTTISVVKPPAGEADSSWGDYVRETWEATTPGTLLVEIEERLPERLALELVGILDERKAHDSTRRAKIVLSAATDAELPDRLRSRCAYVSLST